MPPKKKPQPKAQRTLSSMFGAKKGGKPEPEPASDKKRTPEGAEPEAEGAPERKKRCLGDSSVKSPPVSPARTPSPAPEPEAARPTAATTPPEAMAEDEESAPQPEPRGKMDKASVFKRLRLPSLKASEAIAAVKQARMIQEAKFPCDPWDPAEAGWEAGRAVPYRAITEAFGQISQRSSRLEVTTILCNLMRRTIALTPRDLLPLIYLSVNKMAPPHEGVELGVGESLLIKAIAGSSGKKVQSVKSMYDEEGDLGLVAARAKNTQKMLIKPAALTIRGVYKSLREIAEFSGKDSARHRTEKIQSMLVASQGNESQFVIRAASGSLRIGLAEQTVLSALGMALYLTPPGATKAECKHIMGMGTEQMQLYINSYTERLKQAYSEQPSYDLIVPRLLEDPWKGMGDSRLANGLPVRPMLAKPTHGISEVLDRFTGIEFTCEFKYDGERAQIHYQADRPKGKQIAIYSRNAENHTTKYPDLIELIPQVIEEGVTSFILDSEVVAWDAEKGEVKPFQALQHRGRKNIQMEDIKVPVIVFAFDILELNGRSLLHHSFKERREELWKSFKRDANRFDFAKYRDTSDLEDIQTFLNESMEANCEGLMVKTLTTNATYTPSKRSFNWLKVKKDYLEGVADSFDLVPIGAYYGRGKRTGWFGAYLLACWDAENEELQSICKVATGFSEEVLEKFTKLVTEIPKPKNNYKFDDVHKPDVWLADTLVWEVRAADLSVSPAHRAAIGLVDDAKGIALRFPRFMRVREDKSPSEATDADQIAEMYRRQFEFKAQQEAKKKADGGDKPGVGVEDEEEKAEDDDDDTDGEQEHAAAKEE